MTRNACRLLLLALVPLVGCAGGESDGSPLEVAVALRFVQYDYARFGDHQQMNSPVGGAFVAFSGHTGVAFLNIVTRVDARTDLQVANMPVVGCGGDQEVHFAIDLRPAIESTGRDEVREIEYGASLSSLPRFDLEFDYERAVVERARIAFEPGFNGVVLKPPGPVELIPTFTIPIYEFEANAACHPSFPNQECALLECCPTAVSNSLKFLGAGPGVNDIADCITITGFSGTGCDYVWANLKDAVTSKPPYDVTTEVVPGALGNVQWHVEDFRQVIDAIRAGKDVEMNTYGHAVVVVAAAEVFLGTAELYVLHVAHDALQGEPGGRIIECILYDPADNVYYGGVPGYFDKVQHYQFTIESK